MQERLVQSEKLAALGEMAANVAHELRNPLVSIGGFARRLHKSIEDPKNKRYTTIVIKEVNRLEKILNNVLSFTRRPMYKFEPCQIHKVVNETLEIYYEEMVDKKIECHKEYSEDLPVIEIDRLQFKQALINLVANAIQAMPKGGSLWIRIFEDQLLDNKGLTIEITDTGGGVSEDILHNVFNPFFTTKTIGTGLGLAITHKIVTLHNGRIGLKNEPGKGATFIIKLPLKQRKEATPKKLPHEYI
jgi:signal transduction histidine kinase